MSSVLLTGAAGFIGSQVARVLTEQGHHVIGVDNLNACYDVRLKQYRLEQLERLEGLQFYRVDIEDRDALAEILDIHSVDAVIHLAARAGVRESIDEPRLHYSTNVLGSLDLLELARARQIPKFVLASTSSVHAGEHTPFHEELPANRPISPYAASKKAAEVMACTYHHLFDIDVTVLRYFTVYGPAARPDMAIFRFVRAIDQGEPVQLRGDGSQSRDFVYVDDVARGTVAALKPTGFETINLGGGTQPVSVLDIISRLERLLGKKAQIQHRPPALADMETTRADIRKANRLLDWSPRVSIDEGLARVVEWHCENRQLATSIEL